MPSFDIVSKLDLAEVDNALAGIAREVGTRYDFKDSKSSITRQDGTLIVLADDELKLKQLHELLKGHMTRRKVDAGALDFKPPEKASGKRLVREIKDSRIKVQPAIQGEELRVSGKKRDDLQAAITLLRALKIEQPLQYVNFRE